MDDLRTHRQVDRKTQPIPTIEYDTHFNLPVDTRDNARAQTPTSAETRAPATAKTDDGIFGWPTWPIWTTITREHSCTTVHDLFTKLIQSSRGMRAPGSKGITRLCIRVKDTIPL